MHWFSSEAPSIYDSGQVTKALEAPRAHHYLMRISDCFSSLATHVISLSLSGTGIAYARHLRHAEFQQLFHVVADTPELIQGAFMCKVVIWDPACCLLPQRKPNGQAELTEEPSRPAALPAPP